VSRGIPAKSFEREDGPAGDLGRKPTLERLRRDVKRRKVLAAMLAPPCKTWGTAICRSYVLRTRHEPWGKADVHLQVPPAMIFKLNDGNQAMKITLQLIGDLLAAGISWAFEHPQNSYVFHTAEMQKILCDSRVHTFVLDQCAYGARWRKSTRFVFGNICVQDTMSMRRRCCGQHGICSFTGRKHVVLEGRSSKGRNLTEEAAAYPPRLYHALAKALTATAMAQLYNFLGTVAR
jgi:hypothetical protein